MHFLTWEERSSLFGALMEPRSLPFEDTYRFLDVSMRIRSDSQEVFRFLRGSYPRFHSNAADAKVVFHVTMSPRAMPCRLAIRALNHQYLVFKTTQGFVLSCKNLDSETTEIVKFDKGRLHHLSPSETLIVINDERSEEDQSHLFAFVQIALLRSVATLMPHRHLLHGGAVAWDNHGVILPAATGQGKTMLTLALVKQGFKFLSDDIACLNLATHETEPFPRSLNLRRSGLQMLSWLLKPDKEGDTLMRWPLDIEDFFPNSLGQACPLRYVILLKGFRTRPELTPIPKRQALWQALKLSHTPLTDPARALWRLSPLFNQAQCYELAVGELDTTAALVRDLVEG